MNRNREVFFTLHVVLVTLVCHLHVRYIHLKIHARKLEEMAGDNCKYIMKDLKSSVLIYRKKDIQKLLGYVVLQKENTEFPSLIEETIIFWEGEK